MPPDASGLGWKRAIRKRAERAIILSQRTRHIARLARVLREAKNAWLQDDKRT
jgi:hypothetical protein